MNKLSIRTDEVNFWMCISTSIPTSIDVMLWTRNWLKMYRVSLINFKVLIDRKWYNVSLDYENLNLLLERWEKCIKTSTPVSTTIVNSWKKINLHYFPLNDGKGYIEIYENKYPILINKKIIEKDIDNIICWEVDLYSFIKDTFNPILDTLLTSNKDNDMYFFDVIRERLNLSFSETMSYLNSLSTEALAELVKEFPAYNCYLYWWEPKKVIAAVKKHFRWIKWFEYDKYINLITKKCRLYKYVNNDALWIFPREIYKFINTKNYKKDWSNTYVSMREMKNWVIRWDFSYKELKPLPFYISCNNQDLTTIRLWLESLIPNAQSKKNLRYVRSDKILEIWWEFKRPKIKIRCYHNDLWKVQLVNKKYTYGYDQYEVEYTFLGKTEKIVIEKRGSGTVELIKFFYKSIMDFLTSEYFIDSYKLQKIKYYGEEVSYDSIIGKFESKIIEDYLWEEMKSYIKYLKKRRESIKYKTVKK